VLTPSCMVFTKGILPGHQDIYIYIYQNGLFKQYQILANLTTKKYSV